MKAVKKPGENNLVLIMLDGGNPTKTPNFERFKNGGEHAEYVQPIVPAFPSWTTIVTGRVGKKTSRDCMHILTYSRTNGRTVLPFMATPEKIGLQLSVELEFSA